MTELTPELKRKIADHALGTCGSEDDILSDMGLTEEDLGDTSIAQICEGLEVSCCDGCAWWVDSDTKNEDDLCTDCAEAAYEEENEDE